MLDDTVAHPSSVLTPEIKAEGGSLLKFKPALHPKHQLFPWLFMLEPISEFAVNVVSYVPVSSYQFPFHKTLSHAVMKVDEVGPSPIIETEIASDSDTSVPLQAVYVTVAE